VSHRSPSARPRPGTIGRNLQLVVLGLFALGPLLVMFFNSFKSSGELGANPLGPPTDLDFGNFLEAWHLGDFAAKMLNSAILAGGTAAGVCIIAGLAAYALARLKLRAQTGLLVYVLVSTAVPAQLFVIPLFFAWARAGLTDSRLGLILIYWAIFSPFATLLLRSYLLTLPKEMEEAARIDGASELQVLTRIVIPCARPGFLVVALTTGLFAWNEFYFALTFMQDDSMLPVTAGFLAFRSEYATDWGLTSAAGLIMIAPVVALFLVLQRQFIAGLTVGGVKS
jgi:raffinose/stachyose/melibiose transport system permease protein